MEQQDYKLAMDELQSIVQQVESKELNFDEMITKIKRANQLIKNCEAQLFKIEEEMNSITNTSTL